MFVRPFFTMHRALGAAVVAASCMNAPEAPVRAAQLTEGSACAPVTVDGPRLLRQISLDLRGGPPTEEELRAVISAGSVTPAVLDGMLADPRFIDQAVRWHADLLWPTLGGFSIHQGAQLVLVPGRGRALNSEQTNPEGVLHTLDLRTDEATCPAVGTTGNLTAASCCTASNPTHPSCCLVRNRAYNADDPACINKSRALPAVFDRGVSIGDSNLRGGDTYLGCDNDVEYPGPHVALSDTRWLHDPDGRPYYNSVRGRRRYYYDDHEVPLPYDSYETCPNYCRPARGSGPGGAYVRTDYRPKFRSVGGFGVEGDGPGAACQAGYVEVQNPCDNNVEVRFSSRYELRQEGWRLQRTYWSGGRWIKVCAHEAQERAISLNTGLACMPQRAIDSSCGCGPNGVWCAPINGSPVLLTRAEKVLKDALAEEPLQIVASVIRAGEDYFTAFSTRRGMVNGPLAFMYREQTERMTELAFSPPAPRDSIPELGFDDATWHAYTRGPQHSGVLTTPAYLGRFPTNRARINRFRSVMLCRPFEPPAGGIAAPDDACNREPNLARRCGCQHCHTSIEPLGAYWGRWAERNTNYLDSVTFPVFDPTCASCGLNGAGCPSRCAFYVTTPPDGESARYRGQLQSYLWRTPDEVAHIEQGPSALVAEAVASGEFQSCTVRTLWSRLMHRPMSNTERDRVLPALLRDFDAHHYDYRALVRAVVSTEAYRRID